MTTRNASSASGRSTSRRLGRAIGEHLADPAHRGAQPRSVSSSSIGRPTWMSESRVGSRKRTSVMTAAALGRPRHLAPAVAGRGRRRLDLAHPLRDDDQRATAPARLARQLGVHRDAAPLARQRAAGRPRWPRRGSPRRAGASRSTCPRAGRRWRATASSTARRGDGPGASPSARSRSALDRRHPRRGRGAFRRDARRWVPSPCDAVTRRALVRTSEEHAPPVASSSGDARFASDDSASDPSG